MKIKAAQRVLAAALALVMLIVLVPMGPMRTNAAGQSTTYVFNPDTDVTVGADGDAIVADTAYADGFITTEGKVSQRVKNGSVYCVEVGKNGTGALVFTVTGSADVTLVASSTGGKNTSAVGLVDASGNAVANQEGITEVTATADTTMTYTGLAAGTYKVVSPESSYGRGARIHGLTVVHTVSGGEQPEGGIQEDVYTFFPSTDMETFDKGTKADGDAIAVNEYFTVLVSKNTELTNKEKSFEDGVTATKRLNFNSGASLTKDSIRFTTSNPATVKIWWAAGDNDRQMTLLDSTGNPAATTAEASQKDELYISTLELPEAGTYYLGGTPKKNYIFKVVVTEQGSGGAVKPERADWATVAAPEFTGAETKEDEILVTVKAVVGYDGADEVLVTMYDEAGKELATKRSLAELGEHTLTFKPEASGKYTFKATVNRKDEEGKLSATDLVHEYVLPLEAPVISSATSVGAGGIEIVWNEAKEAASYHVYVDGELVGTTSEQKYTVTGLTVGTKYSFTVEAVRGEDKTVSGAVSATATQDAQSVWSTTIYGPSTNEKNNGVEGNINEDGAVTVYSESGKGKLQYKDSDGLTYYYTAIPEDQNFTFRVKIHVDNWVYSNGQEGFGIMATDRVAPNGVSTWWSNQYMAMVSKVEYRYDAATGKVFHTDSSDGVKYNLRLGVGATAKLGITPENLPLVEKNDTNTILSVANGVTYPLNIGFAQENAAGDYNVTANCGNPDKVAEAGLATVEEISDFILEIQRNNTGYFITYYDAEGNIIGQQKNYDPKALSHLDTENVYVGFFAARNARVTCTIQELSTVAPSEDAPAEERPITYIAPTMSIVSADVTTDDQYTLSVSTNVSGTLQIKLNDTVLEEAAPVTGGTRYDLGVTLAQTGSNRFYVVFTPDANQDLGEFTKLENADPINAYLKLTYNTDYSALSELYVSPTGSSGGKGTKDSPLDIYTAVQNVTAGQTILLMEGSYKLDKEIVIQRGIDGTAQKPIRMIADPEAASRPILNFQRKAPGLTAVGNYWYFQGFDVTSSVNGKPGFHLCGSYNTLEGINAYYNGNTGIQISRYRGSDHKSEWPSNNLVLNCTSYGNADAGYEDADGFAAKLTCGEGNVFDGCVAHHNADDGWDLYAKVETGPIGAVTIRNCVAYANGYLEDGTNAGNGNGFKLGGSNIPGGHKLINSYAFYNKAKGIDSNSCPDVIVENCTTFNNESYNVAFYTNINQNTDFQAAGILSYKDANVKSGFDKADNLKPRGNQDISKYLGDSNYYWNGAASSNGAGAEVTGEIFVSLEFKGVKRNADGTIDLQGFLQLKADAGVTGGAKPAGTASQLPALPDHETHPDDFVPSDPSNPGTGDAFSPVMWVVILLAAAMGMILIPRGLRKRSF